MRGETATQCLEKLAASMKDIHGVAARLQQRLQEVGKRRIIIDDCETGRHGAEASSGNAMPTAPRPLAIVQIRPPASAIVRQARGRAMPCPPRHGSNVSGGPDTSAAR